MRSTTSWGPAMTEGLAEDSDDLGEPAAAGADDQRWPTTDVVAVILLPLAVAAVCASRQPCGWRSTRRRPTASPASSGSVRSGSRSRVRRHRGRAPARHDGSVWWQAGVVLDRLDEDDVVPSGRSHASAAASGDPGPARGHRCRRRGGAARSGRADRRQPGPRDPAFPGPRGGGVVVAALAGCAAAHRAVRSMRQDLSSRRPTAR